MDAKKIDATKVKRSLNTLTNACDLGAYVILSLAGNDVSNTIGGERITMRTLANIGLARFNKYLNLTTIRG